MTNPVFAEDDDGFLGYVETSHDPGSSLIFATVLFCIISYCSLPFMIAMGNRLDVKNKNQQQSTSRRTRRSKRRKADRKQPPNQPQKENDDNDDSDDDGDLQEECADPIFECTEASAFAAPFDDTDAASVFSVAPSISSIASFHSHRTRKRRNHRNKRTMEKRVELEEFELRMQRYGEYPFDEVDCSRLHVQRQHRSSSPERSVMAPLDQDDVSVEDAVSQAARSPHRKQISLMAPHHGNKPNLNNHASPEGILLATGDSTFLDTMLDLVQWDFEFKRIIKLAIPFATQALSTGILDSITVAVIGKILGTKEVSAFVTVRTLIDVSSSFFGGFHESIATLCSQAMGRHNYKLVGQYVQLSMLFYVISYIPFIILWWVYMPSLLLWFGFDAETAEIGKEYTQVYLFLELIDGVDEAIHGLLDVIDLESYSTLVGVSQEVVTFLDILCCALFAKPSLFVIGLIELFVAIIFIGINVGTIIWRGWFEPYREGLVGSCALYNKHAAKMMLGTASSLSLGYLLTDGEWEILTLFASVLGPAEVAAWGILGVLWEAVEQLTEAIADASEVRCAFLLGSGQPEKAKRSAYKSIFIGIFLSLFLTSIIFMLGESIATWFTDDPALQHIIADLIPLFGIGNMTLTMGTISWTLLGSQGRYRLATFVAFIASWFVTLPMAAVFTFQLKINLQGQTAAIVIGYMVSGSINAYLLFRSDWEQLSKSVQKANENDVAAPPEADLDELAARTLDCHATLPNLGTLDTLMEGKSGEESVASSDYDVSNPVSSPKKESA